MNEHRHHQPPHMTKIARELRAKMSVPERLLWGALRNRRLAGFKFRRQAPVGPYVADFLCEEHKLIVELDGESHIGTGVRDARRSDELHRMGYRVLRVTNDDVAVDLDAVVAYITHAALDCPGSSPSPQRGEVG
jgi:very-short-patch-repair endonuclease